jgi:hypothetical protein
VIPTPATIKIHRLKTKAVNDPTRFQFTAFDALRIASTSFLEGTQLQACSDVASD